MRKGVFSSTRDSSVGRRLLYPVQLIVHIGLLGVFVGSFAPLFMNLMPALATFESFYPHLAVASLLLTLPALLFRPRWFALLGPIAFAWSVANILPYLPTREFASFGALKAVADVPSAAPGTRTLKVVSANVWYRNDGFSAALNYFDATNADIIAVIEATPQWKIALEPLYAKYPYRADCVGAQPPCEIMLLSKLPLRRSFAGRIEGRSPSIAWGEVELGGKPVVVAVTHLSWPLLSATDDDAASAAGTLPPPPLKDAGPLLQGQQAQTVAQYLQELGPDLVLMGDFNSVPWSHTLSALRAATGLEDAGPMVPTWPAWQPRWVRLPIDHIMTRGALQRLDFRRGKWVGSDHLPVEATIAIQPK